MVISATPAYDLNTFRKPRCYDILVTQEIAEPFVRADARR